MAHSLTPRHVLGRSAHPLATLFAHHPLLYSQEHALILLAGAGANLQTVNGDGERADALLPERLRVQLMEG